MELEKRVQRMEEDISILKNQVRNTLLDIQEQLASSYHPSLRAARSAAARGESTPSPEDYPTGEVEKQATPPKVKKVSLQQLRHAEDGEGTLEEGFSGEGALAEASVGALSTQLRDGRVGLDLLTKIIRWTHASAAAIGPLHTRRVLETYAADGHLPPQVVDKVVALAGLSSVAPPAVEPAVGDVLAMLVSLGEALTSAPGTPAGPEPRHG